MKFSSISAFALALSLATLSLTGCKKDADSTPTDQKGTFTMEFEHTVGTAPLVLATQSYTTPTGDQLKITKFNYYISNIKLTKADGTQYVQPESYYLIESNKSDSQLLTMKDVPTADYTGITFTIGVDSVRNVAGAQTGALDTNNGMFWSWNSGYIYAKLEGTSPQAPKPAGASEGGVVFHIGGFKKPNNTIRTVSPAFPNGTKLLVRTDHTPEIHLNVDVLKMLTGTTTVRFATLSNTMGGPNSVLIANNYAQGNMFSIEHIHAN